MSLVLTGTDSIIVLLILISINLFFIIKKIPIISIPFGLISIGVIVSFSFEYNAINLIFMIIVLFVSVADIILNVNNLRKK